MQGKIRAGQKHEYNQDPFNGWRIISANTGIVIAESAGGHGAEGMANRIKRSHAGYEQGYYFQESEQSVNIPQQFGRFPDTRRKSFRHRPRHFGPEKLHPSHTQ